MVLTYQFFSAEDEAAAARSTAKNGLESYAYNLRNSLIAADKPKLETAVNDTIKWLEASQEGSKEEQEEKQRDFQATARQVFFFLGHELVAYVLFLALSFNNSGDAGGPRGYLAQVASPVVLLVVFLDPRKVSAWKSLTIYIYQSFGFQSLCMASTSTP